MLDLSSIDIKLREIFSRKDVKSHFYATIYDGSKVKHEFDYSTHMIDAKTKSITFILEYDVGKYCNGAFYGFMRKICQILTDELQMSIFFEMAGNIIYP